MMQIIFHLHVYLRSCYGRQATKATILVMSKKPAFGVDSFLHLNFKLHTLQIKSNSVHQDHRNKHLLFNFIAVFFFYMGYLCSSGNIVVHSLSTYSIITVLPLNTGQSSRVCKCSMESCNVSSSPVLR